MSALRKPTYTEVKDKFELLRAESRQGVLDDLPPYLRNKLNQIISTKDIGFSGLTLNAYKELELWESMDSRRVSWEWDEVRKKYRTHPKRFELAVWYRGNTLCSAAIGRPTWTGGRLRLDFIESAPMGTALDGLAVDLALLAADDYATEIGATQIRIMKPVNKEVRDHYLSKPGFKFHERGNYCYRDMV